jgi:hypothetical protein
MIMLRFYLFHHDLAFDNRSWLRDAMLFK